MRRRQIEPSTQHGEQATGRAIVEAPFALLQIEMEVLPGNAVVAAQMTLGLAPEVLDPIDVVAAVGEPLPVVDALVSKLRHIKNIVGSKAIGADNGVWLDSTAHDRHQGSSCRIGNDESMDFASTLQKPEHRHLAGSTSASLSLAPPTEIALVNLDFAGEQLGRLGRELRGNQFPQLVVEQGGRVPVHTDQLRGGSSRCASHKMPNKGLLANNREAAPPT